MHGSIDVVSSLEAGTSFVATMPLFTAAPAEGIEVDEARTAAGEAAPLEQGAVAGGESVTSPDSVPMDATERALVLVVEDNDDMRLFLKRKTSIAGLYDQDGHSSPGRGERGRKTLIMRRFL